MSCDQRTFDSRDELISYIQDTDNEYTHAKSVKGVDVKVQYRPHDLIVSQYIKGNDNSKTSIDSLRRKFKDYLYFNISFSSLSNDVLLARSVDRSSYGQLSNRLSFEMKNYILLRTTQGDTINLFDYSFPKTYGKSKSSSLLCVFPIPHNQIRGEYLNLTVQEFGLKTGELNFKIPIEKIKKQPELQF
ncbi:MAG: hypothetical protein DWP94_04280 [Flavobacterium sp.]|nr:MAG: hypothetical protein DWP94_04280 [Flavobacterium sp.]